MSKRDELIEKYAEDLKSKLGVTPDMDLLRKVTIGCGPSIYNRDASTVSGSDKSELETVKNNFLIKKHGLSASQDLDGAIASVMEKYGKSERNKFRAVVYYMLTKHFGLEGNYK
jgi:hypothetical protein